jgi:hypothetical protein
MKPLAVIDGDIIAYRCAAASEQRTIQAMHKVTGEVRDAKTRTEFKLSLKDPNEFFEWDIIDVQTPEPVEYCFHSINSMIKTITEACDTNQNKLVLGGKTNFRLDIPLPTQYKANRVETLRPKLLLTAREYIKHKLKAEVSEGIEADDVLSIYAYEGFKTGKKIVQCSLDKDSMQCEGWVYNWNTMQSPFLVKGFGKLSYDKKEGCKGYGRIWLLAQSLMGDAADGYKPVELANKKFGDVGCYKVLGECKNDKEAVLAVYNQYKEWYPESVTYKAWNGKEYTKDAVDIWEMYFDCARMLRKREGDIVHVQDILNKMKG